MMVSSCTICKPPTVFAFVCVCMHSWLAKNADCYVYIYIYKKSNLILLQKMFLHLDKKEYSSPVLAELFEDILEWYNRTVRKSDKIWSPEAYKTVCTVPASSMLRCIFWLPYLFENCNCTHTHTEYLLSLLCLTLFISEAERELLVCNTLSKKMIKNISLLAEIYPHENYPALVQPDLWERLPVRDFWCQ